MLIFPSANCPKFGADRLTQEGLSCVRGNSPAQFLGEETTLLMSRAAKWTCQGIDKNGERFEVIWLFNEIKGNAFALPLYVD